MDERDQGSPNAAELEPDAEVSGSLVALMRARDVRLSGSAAGLVAAGGGLSIDRGGCGAVIANGPATIRYGGCGPLIANGDVSIEYGGAQTILAAGGANIGSGGFVGLVGSPKVTVEDGGRVLISMRQALALGAAAGVTIALLSRLFRR
jgi:hypothetical protein